ncbi:filamentous hemagglutinin N-terminal domain-containing protein, partial [Trinickia fusca]
MNNNTYRLVYSRLRGMAVAVEETATAAGQSAGGETRAGRRSRTARTATAAMALSGILPMLASAQIVPTPGTGTQVIQSQNGLPQVNVARPSNAGVSVNTYNQFDVNRAGAILNNAATLTNTQLAGYVNGNPNYGAGEAARIIVNQVNSANPSQLRGFVEIAGPKAEVVLANPSGIYVDGGGFINTSRAILTTGAPFYSPEGGLAGFNVNRGLVTVAGAGLNAANIDQVDLIARAVQVNAAVYAKNLNVVAGANQVNRDTLVATLITGEGPAPTVAIDIGQLGGMYSNRIFLASNEYGVGVASAGTLTAQAGELTLQANGRLVLTGKTTASGNLALSAAGGIDNSGTTYSQQSATVSTAADLTNSGTLTAQQSVGVNAGSVNSTGTLGAGVNNEGSVSRNGDLTVTTAGRLNATGWNVVGGNATLIGSDVNLAGSQTAANGNLLLKAIAGDLNLSGATTSAKGTLRANASGALTNDRGNLSSGSGMTLTAGSLSNQSGNVSSQGPLSVQASGQIANQAGTMVSQSTVRVNGGAIANHQGTLQSAGGMTVSGTSLDNTAGRITSLKPIGIPSGPSDGLTITTSGQLTNAAGMAATGAQGGVIGGNGDVTVQGGAVVNHGTITAQANLHVTGQSVDNSSGLLKAGQNATVDAGARFANSGGSVLAKQAATVNATTVDNSHGTTEATQLTFNASDLVNHGGTITQTGNGPVAVNVSGTLDNSNGGTLQTKSTDLTLTPATLVNDGGVLTHAGTGTLTLTPGNGVGSLSNVGGKIAGNGHIVARAGTLENRTGSIIGQTGLGVAVGGALDNAQGKLLSNADATIDVGDALTNNGGALGADATATIHSGSLTNRGGSIVVPNLTATVDSTLDNSGGNLEANQLALTTTDLTNHGGKITQYGASPMTISVSNRFDNSVGG